MTCTFFLLLFGGGQNKPAWTACPLSEDNQGEGQDSPGQLIPQGASQPWLACPRGSICPGGKFNWDSGSDSGLKRPR